MYFVVMVNEGIGRN